ncbi:MAG: polysaccharide deacetylase family protein [Rhodanobacter sp.]|nr:MAG: polysaccharide deacetylase family protein [Rhodanobacter sp.]TAM13336.1 MAG: polysaccharide deacetylase family protein [Rhodanobacter sp.]TAM35105.1 MAG: polysaccharide deacetylase family protein [Rhodanobacter sp.]
MRLKPSKRQLLGLLPTGIAQTRGAVGDGARYLTFDDGPHPEHTPRLLDLLQANGARASFFVIGKHAERYPRLVERIVADGHLLGNHSWNHDHYDHLGLAEQLAELDRTDALLARFDGRARHRVRTPQGVLPLPLLFALARRRRSVAYWSYDSLDYRKPPVAELVGRLQRVPPMAGDIVLMHDDNALACDALAQLLPVWCATGFRFLSLSPERSQ